MFWVTIAFILTFGPKIRQRVTVVDSIIQTENMT